MKHLQQSPSPALGSWELGGPSEWFLWPRGPVMGFSLQLRGRPPKGLGISLSILKEGRPSPASSTDSILS